MKRLVSSEFVLKAQSVHKDRYNYSLVEYKNNKTKVVIICPKHGEFIQTPLSHLNGHGCGSCRSDYMSKVLKMNNCDFVKKAKSIHGEKYDYSKAGYTLLKNSVKIICKKHGMFDQNAHNHLQGAGCPDCAKETPEHVIKERKINFINKSRLVHSNCYCYDNVTYINTSTKVKIKCKKHGFFYQTPADHSKGHGCPGCAKHGFDRTKKGFLYVLRSDCGKYMKIGVSNNPNQRNHQLSRDTPFSFRRIELIEGDGKSIAELEKRLLGLFEKVVFKNKFPGSTEWRVWSDQVRKNIIGGK